MVKIAILGIVVVMLALPFRIIKGEYSLYLSLAGCILIFYFVLGKMQQVIELMEKIGTSLPIESGYLEILIKIIGITYITEFSADLCKDAGYSALASQIAIAGKLSVLGISMPVNTALLEMVSGLWK